MNIDFFILIIIYLAIILGIHYKLKNYDKIPNLKSIISETKFEKDLVLDEEILDEEIEQELLVPTEIIDENIDNKLIIDTNELNNIGDDVSNDFLKYLKVEENDNNEVYRKLSDSMDINLTENIKSLDSFFPEQKENYTFDEVSTISKKPTGLLNKVKNLNDEHIFDQVYAFDEFNDSYALI